MTIEKRSIAARVALGIVGPMLLAACSPVAPRASVDGHSIVPIDPNRPGDPLFSEGLTLYRQAETEQTAGLAARKGGDTATATADLLASVTDYGLARDKFDPLMSDPSLCPDVSIRCDNAAYLAGRSSYERGMIEHDLAGLIPDAALLPVSQASLADAQARLDAMLFDFPSSAFVHSAAYFA